MRLPRFAPGSFRWRIGLPYVLLILALMASLGAYFSRYLEKTYLNAIETELVAQARLTGAALAPEIAAGMDPDQLNGLAKVWAEVLDKRVTIVAPDGAVIGESEFDRLVMDNHAGRPEIVRARLTGQGVEVRYSDTLDADMMYAAAPIRQGGEIIGYARVAMPLSRVAATLANLQRTLLLATLAAAALAALLAIWIAGRTTRPVRRLAEAAAQAAEGRFESHLIPTTNDEIGRLTEQFNAMTARIGAQIRLLDAERSRMAAVLEAMSDGVLIIDAAGKVQLINAAAEGMFNLHAGDVIGRSPIEVLRHHQVQELLEACRRSGQAQSATVEIPIRGLYLQAAAAPLGQALPGSILMLFQNLTRLRRLETVRQDFVSNISHELRTPLASLKALTETLQEGALDDPPAAHRFLGRMETEVDALTQMVEELLELTRIESGRVPLRLAPTPPARLVEAAVERLRVQAERAGLTIETEVPAGVPEVLADARRLEQVIVNLLHNAIKFTPSGGRIGLSAQPSGEMVAFAVQDTGAGIPAADLPRIFERFYKTDRARAGGGTGLGLAIARHLVEAHGGKIWAESVEGRGSTFRFTIPTEPVR